MLSSNAHTYLGVNHSMHGPVLSTPRGARLQDKMNRGPGAIIATWGTEASGHAASHGGSHGGFHGIAVYTSNPRKAAQTIQGDSIQGESI